ncbi:MAG: FecR family protein [Bacteriovoracia bacterium]
MRILLVLCIFTMCANLFAKAAKIVIMRGKVSVSNDGKKFSSAQKNQWLNEGTIIQTQKGSFAKLLYMDKTQVSVGPNSSAKIVTAPQEGQKGLVNLVKGKIRSAVVRNPMADGKENKFFIKTKSAAMGVRGTDFSVIYNDQNNVTSTITYEGEVKMISLGQNAPIDQAGLNQMLNSPTAVSVRQGQFSNINPQGSNTTTIPTKLNPAQFNSLKNNASMEEGSPNKTSQNKVGKYRSIIPMGADAKEFSAKSEGLNETLGTKTIEIAETEIATEAPIAEVEAPAPPPEGMVNQETGQMAPPAGGFVDLKTGIYVAPPPGSAYDPVSETYVPPADMGSFDPDGGGYVPPEGLELDHSGEFKSEGNETEASVDKPIIDTNPLPPEPALAPVENEMLASETDSLIDSDPELDAVYDNPEDTVNDTSPEVIPSSTKLNFEITVQ